MIIHETGGFHKWGYPNNRGFIVENPTKMDDDWGTPIAGTPQVDTGILMVGYLFFSVG